MDKLEKALEKARELRRSSAVSSETVVAAPVMEPADSVHAAPRSGAGAATRKIEVNDADLERHRVVALLKRNANADIFRILRTKILQKMMANNWRTVAVTSANYGDGKTTVAINLALSLALDVKQTVLLVDLDLRSPDVHRYIGVDPEVSLSDHFLRGVPIPDCLVKPAFERIVVLPITETIENSSELLGSPKMADLARELSTRYKDRIVIYDMPPLLTQDDTIAFIPHVDGVILVVRDGVTLIDQVKDCMHQLENTNLLGVVLNDSA